MSSRAVKQRNDRKAKGENPRKRSKSACERENISVSVNQKSVFFSVFLYALCTQGAFRNTDEDIFANMGSDVEWAHQKWSFADFFEKHFALRESRLDSGCDI